MDDTSQRSAGKSGLTDRDRARLAAATLRQQRRLGIALNRRAALTLLVSLLSGKGGRS